MESGTSSFTRCGRAFLLVLAFAAVIGSASAQQAGNGIQSGPGTKPAEPPAALPPTLPPALPAAQPISQAAVSQSGAAPAKAPDAAQATADQAKTVKLGPADLIEVHVYNVPELTSKVRVR